MVPSFLSVREDEGEVLADKYREALNIAPSATMTGINEHGVTCNSNVMPISDGTNCIYQIFGKKVVPDMLPAGGTHPEYPASSNLNVGASVQFVLDNAESAADALRKLSGRNVYGGLGNFDYIQLMIADPNRTFVVEFLGPYTLVIGFGEADDQKALEQEFADLAATGKVRFVNRGQKPIMTNWWHFFDTYPDTVVFTNHQNHANGVERYRALDRYYDESATFEGMRDLMKRVKFSNVGRMVPGEDEFYPFTDNNVPPRPSWLDFANDTTAVEEACRFRSQYNDQIFVWRQRGDFSGNWITAHSAVIDMERGTLDIVVWEDWKNPYQFSFIVPEGCEKNPWKVGTAGSEDEVTAWTNGTDTLVVEGSGEIGSMPWAESADGITKLIKSEGVKDVERLVGSLPELETVNGFTLEDFGNAIRGFVAADGFSAIEIANGRAFLDVVVGRSDSLGASAEWAPVSTNTVEVPAPGEQGFFIVSPLFYIPGTDYTITGGVEDPFKHRHTR